MGYAEWLWNKWGRKLRPMYQRIDEWDVPWLRDLCEKIWVILPNKTKKVVYEFITYVHKEYGEEIAKKLMANLKEFIDKIVD